MPDTFPDNQPLVLSDLITALQSIQTGLTNANDFIRGWMESAELTIDTPEGTERLTLAGLLRRWPTQPEGLWSPDSSAWPVDTTGTMTSYDPQRSYWIISASGLWSGIQFEQGGWLIWNGGTVGDETDWDITGAPVIKLEETDATALQTAKLVSNPVVTRLLALSELVTVQEHDGVFGWAFDAQNQMLLGYDSNVGQLAGAFPFQLTDLLKFLSDRQAVEIEEHNGVYSLLLDQHNRNALGFDSVRNRLAGAFPPAAPVQQMALDDWHEAIPSGTRFGAWVYGQSLGEGATATPALTTSQSYGHTTFAGGVRTTNTAQMTGTSALVEATQETIASTLANYTTKLAAMELGQAISWHPMFVHNASLGSQSIASLSPGGSSGRYDDVVEPALTNFATLYSGQPVIAMCWLQGESDRNGATTYQDYYDALIALQAAFAADVQTATGQTFTPPIITYQMVAAIAADPSVSLAQLDACEQEPDKFILGAPLYHIPHNTDELHLTNIGELWLGHYFAKKYYQFAVLGKRPQHIQCMSATAVGTELRLRFKVPVAPLRLDIQTLAETQDFGFAVEDDTGVLTLSGIHVADNGVEVVVTLDRALGANPEVRYALDYYAPELRFKNDVGASGNLCDSDPLSFTHDGTTYPLFEVCPAFRKPIIQL